MEQQENVQEHPQQSTAAGQGQAMLGVIMCTIGLIISWKFYAFGLFSIIGLVMTIGGIRTAKKEYGPVELLVKVLIVAILIVLASAAIFFLTPFTPAD